MTDHTDMGLATLDALLARLEQVEAERDALAAKLGRLNEVVILGFITIPKNTKEEKSWHRIAKSAAQSSPEKILEQVVLKSKASALECIARRFYPSGLIGKGEERRAALLQAADYRQQAEGDES